MYQTLQDFSQFYQKLDQDSIDQLPDIYADDIEFCDPVHRIHGIDKLQHYFNELIKELISCQFDIEQIMHQQNEAFIRWTMHFQHPRINKSRTISVPGITHLKFDDKITYHRDYFDVGAMLYEHIPLLGGIIRKIKKRLSE